MTADRETLPLVGNTPRDGTSTAKRTAGAVFLLVAAVVASLYAIIPSGHRVDNNDEVADLQQIVDAHTALFSGVVEVRSKTGNDETKCLLSNAYCFAHEEFQVPMATDVIFPIGSNSKLFTSVALYQLQEKNKVNLSLPVNTYLTQQDFAAFGFPNQTTWCPRVEDAAPDSPCENITFVQLMYMGSGIGDELNCDNVPSERCHQSANDFAVYRGSIGAHVGMFINDPLVFKPDSNYSYSNMNYVLLSYMVEKLSGQKFGEYIEEHIAKPLGLNSTYYDEWSGGKKVRFKYASEYAHFYVKTDNATNTTVDNPATLKFLSSGTCSPHMHSGAVSGSGGMRSTVDDMQRWYLDLFHDHGRQSRVLTPESIANIVFRHNPINSAYAQGVGAIFEANNTNASWPDAFAYCGGVKCTTTCMALHITGGTSRVASAFSNAQVDVCSSAADFDALVRTGNLLDPQFLSGAIQPIDVASRFSAKLAGSIQ
ncbi:TPA: hypothetical protein N0F65_005819 [Lagenidium giganteum]|uniref:Beta-lactamase-related domain-containing protein n=1 Tax=Lagenidium giganteum TaxID=4803 RepID=A0AAV2YRK8_9STRA|nr:TPA: hypothetical protein N0F65_005819 [Lagenidium giganteum]